MNDNAEHREKFKKRTKHLSFSIVTPSYNQGEFIEETINSVLSQGYPNLEYIVVDAGSTDDTHKILARYRGQIDKIIIEPDNGPADAIRKGWNGASGDILAYLNSDDIYLPGAIQKVADSFSRESHINMICGNELRINTVGNVLGQSSIEHVDYCSLLSLCFIPQPSVFVRKNVLAEVGGINPQMRFIFDFDLWVRIAKKHAIRCIPDLLSATRWHENTITLKRRADIVNELNDLVNREFLSESGAVPSAIKRFIFGKLNRLQMNVALEVGRHLSSLGYACKSVYYSPTYANISKIIKKQRQYMLPSIQIQDGSNDSEELMTHWSSYCPK
jgi:glycosyltransferase involved in cell wall biosynthesis